MRHEIGSDDRHRIIEGGNAEDPPRRHGIENLGGIGELPQLLDQPAKIRCQRLGARRRHHAAGVRRRQKQGIAEKLAQPHETSRQRRLADAEALGGMGDGAMAQHGVEGQKQPEIEFGEAVAHRSRTGGRGRPEGSAARQPAPLRPRRYAPRRYA